MQDDLLWIILFTLICICVYIHIYIHTCTSQKGKKHCSSFPPHIVLLHIPVKSENSHFFICWLLGSFSLHTAKLSPSHFKSKMLTPLLGYHAVTLQTLSVVSTMQPKNNVYKNTYLVMLRTQCRTLHFPIAFQILTPFLIWLDIAVLTGPISALWAQWPLFGC